MKGLRLMLCALLLSATPVHAGEVRAAVAANFTAPMQALVALFEQTSGHKVTPSFGATGALYAQIRHGAPFDLFLAADTATPERLVREGLAGADSCFVYARGTLVLWSSQPGYVDGAGEVLRHGRFGRLAIGDPKLAIYGRAAQETLEGMGLWARLQSRLVKGNSITQTWQFAASGNAELGFIALSQITQGGKVREGSWWIVPAHYYNPIEQSAVLLSSAADAEAAQAFLDFLKGPQAAGVIRSYGYELP